MGSVRTAKKFYISAWRLIRSTHGDVLHSPSARRDRGIFGGLLVLGSTSQHATDCPDLPVQRRFVPVSRH